MSHTKGPWHTHERAIHTHHTTGTGVKHFEVATAAFHNGLSLDPNELHQIAEANARLIAAAPELLEACKAFQAAFDELFNGAPLFQGGKMIDHARLNEAGRLTGIAIAKAEAQS